MAHSLLGHLAVARCFQARPLPQNLEVQLMRSHSVHCPEQKLFLSLQKQFCPFLTRVQSKGHAFTHCNNLTHNLGTTRKWGSSAACVSGAHLAGLLPSAPSLWRVRSASAHSDLGEHSDGRQSRDRRNRRAFHVSAGPGGSVLTVPQIPQSPVTGAAGSFPPLPRPRSAHLSLPARGAPHASFRQADRPRVF